MDGARGILYRLIINIAYLVFSLSLRIEQQIGKFVHCNLITEEKFNEKDNPEFILSNQFCNIHKSYVNVRRSLAHY